MTQATTVAPRQEVYTDDSGKLTVTRRFNAPQELVFSMFNAENITRWWAPEPYVVAGSVMDFRTGGSWFYHMLGVEGDKMYVLAHFTEVTPPSRFVYENRFAHEDRSIDPSVPGSTYTFTFSEVDGQTEVRMEFAFDSAEELNVVLGMGMVGGLTMGLDQLEALL